MVIETLVAIPTIVRIVCTVPSNQSNHRQRLRMYPHGLPGITDMVGRRVSCTSTYRVLRQSK